MTARLVRLLERRGLDAAGPCDRAGISIEEATDACARVPFDIADALVEECVALLGEKGFALALSRVVDVDTYEAAGLLLLSSATFGEGLARALAYQRLWADGERFSLLRGAAHGTVRFRHPSASPVARDHLAELAFLETLGAARRLVDTTIRPLAVRFAHEPLAPDELAEVLGIQPTYGAPHNELVLDERVLAAPIHVPEGALIALHTALAEQAMRALPQGVSLASRVRALFASNPRLFCASLAEMAARLRLPPRSVQRELLREATTYSELVDAARRERVHELDARAVQSKEIAYLVGFADPSALARARRRWAGE